MSFENVQIFKTARRLLTGENASYLLPKEMLSLKIKRPLIVTDRGVLKAGLIEPIITLLNANGIADIFIYSDISAEPETHIVQACCNTFDQNLCDGVIAIGGGSAMDTAKAVAVFSGETKPLTELFGEDNVAVRTIPLICMPTTAGTGSEVTNISILLDVQAELKKGIVSNELLPDVAIVAPELTLSCPASVTAASGVDALVHAVESFLSNFSSEITRSLSIGAIPMIIEALPIVYKDPDNIQAREKMATASLMAGLAFGNAGVGAVHALAYPLGGQFHLSHGVSNALMFSHVMRWNYSACPEKFRDIAIAMGANNAISLADSGSYVVEKIESLCEAVGIAKRLRDYAIEQKDISELANAASGVTRLLRNNPRELSVQDIEAIYTEAF